MILTILFSLLMFGLFLFVVGSFFIKNNTLEKFATRIMFSAPTMLTSLGILGTFVGISVALLDFDTQNLDASIPSLLDGMKIAFITSAIGITLSILLKLIMLVIGKENENEENNLLLAHIKNQSHHLEVTIPNLLNELIKQAKKQENKLSQELKNFKQGLTERTTEHIIEALEGVVVNFNDSLAHQFGENFARLDDSVKGMLEWQEAHKNLLGNISNKYELNARTLSEVKDSMLMIEKSISHLPELINDFEKLIRFNQKQIGQIGDQMIIFTEIKEKALASFPEIDDHFTRIANTIEKLSINLDRELSLHTKNIGNNLSNVINKFVVDFEKSNIEALNKNIRNYDQMLNLMSEIKPVLEAFKRDTLMQLSEMKDEFNKSSEKLAKEQIDSYQKEIENQMSNFQNMISMIKGQNQEFIQKLFKANQEKEEARRNERSFFGFKK